ncbi:butyrophilin subfamily 1 member A1-like [Chanos chanos]|uniref:Butyrophilin subfamily 1 member A1-like n=1 Tax=Chanos chanos TaxID=29144 RepID=A0A6J2VSN4_CHACN|nr:butyrophilin subfamily 1 member A1-like [Chanos chanos]
MASGTRWPGGRAAGMELGDQEALEVKQAIMDLSLTCTSYRGWNPQPEVLWLNTDGEILPAEDTQTVRETEGFYVKRSLTVPDSNTNRVLCRVILKHHVKKTDVIIAESQRKKGHEGKYHIISESDKKMLEEIFETRREYAVDVTLDPDTAHHDLILSDDGKEVRIEDNHSNVDKMRFDKFNCVLGKEGFQSGKFYYEVQVGDKPYWFLGVATESAERNGHFIESPESGYWTIMLRAGTQDASKDRPASETVASSPLNTEKCTISRNHTKAHRHRRGGNGEHKLGFTVTGWHSGRDVPQRRRTTERKRRGAKTEFGCMKVKANAILIVFCVFCVTPLICWEQASVDEGATEIRRRMHSLPLPPNMLTKQRLYSAPPALWAAKKCGRQLRRMSDEFDLMKDEESPDQVVGPSDPVFAVAGEDVVLPCSLKPNISAVGMTVEWIRRHTSDSLVHLYKDHEDRNSGQIWSYRGRTALFKDELQEGNASLKLSGVKVSDEGGYKCLIQSQNKYDDVNIQVKVEAIGTHPEISMESYSTNGGISLLCESKHWRPEPEILWLNDDGEVLFAKTETLTEKDGFYLKHRVTVQNSGTNKFFCRVKLRDHMKEANIFISNKIFHTWEIFVSFITVLVLIIVTGLIVMALCILKQRGSELRRVRREFKKRKFHAVDVTLDPDTAHPELLLSDDGKQVTHGDTRQDLPDNPKRFIHGISVLGQTGFSSGRFYYEVLVTEKTEWALGVATESVNRKGRITLNPMAGFWTVILRKGNRYQARDVPRSNLLLRRRPQKVGVYVDYEEGEISFYDADTKSLIYSFTGRSFSEKLYPFFSPCFNLGGTNSTPLIISPVKFTE